MNEVISCMVLQPDSIRIRNEKNCQRMTEVWKGPWSEIKKLTDLKSSDVFGAKLYPGIIRPQVLDRSTQAWRKEFSMPTASTLALDVEWLIENVEAHQIEAGDLGLLTIDCSSVRENGGSGGGDPSNPDAPEGAVLTQPTAWTLTWRAFTRSPIEYAGTTPDGTASDIKHCYENDKPGTLAEAARYRTDIDASNLRYAYFTGVEGIDRELKLLAAEGGTDPQARTIYDYMCKGITPQFHAPAVTKQDYFRTLPGISLNIAGADASIDKKGSLPNDCPYLFTANYEWLKTDNSYQVTQNTFEGTSYTRTQTWLGALQWDDNFYGANAWPLPPVEQT